MRGRGIEGGASRNESDDATDSTPGVAETVLDSLFLREQ